MQPTDSTYGTIYGSPLTREQKAAVRRALLAEIDKHRAEAGEVTGNWIRVFEVLLFIFYSGKTGRCFPSHAAIAAAARVSVRTVRRALAWARRAGLIDWAHGLVRATVDGVSRVLRTSNRYAFSSWLWLKAGLKDAAASVCLLSNGQTGRGKQTLSFNPLSWRERMRRVTVEAGCRAQIQIPWRA